MTSNLTSIPHRSQKICLTHNLCSGDNSVTTVDPFVRKHCVNTLYLWFLFIYDMTIPYKDLLGRTPICVTRWSVQMSLEPRPQNVNIPFCSFESYPLRRRLCDERVVFLSDEDCNVIMGPHFGQERGKRVPFIHDSFTVYAIIVVRGVESFPTKRIFRGSLRQRITQISTSFSFEVDVNSLL